MAKDIDFRFKLHPLTGDLITKKDEDSIKQALRSIVMTNSGERRFDYDFGSGVYSLLFENLDIFAAEFYRKRLLNAISLYEERVQVMDVQLIQNNDDGSLFVNIEYRLKDGGEVQEFSVGLERVN